ncbi:hypothetical protein IW261DRAFT_1419050 [Armillaria novae-zelandiae]|uniref:Uncharacterized protein n=1 Tax=Armillaria novae-zelandiae TaxID=153914 RepID=A0AA39PB95_9AGAR|nr:hypothetical protein IW261DRAFT_1419050 [Armillaria novae-zelandiae]
MWFNISYHLRWTPEGYRIYNHAQYLETAISTRTYVHRGILYTRTAFATHLDNVTVIGFTANVSPAISFNTPFVTPMDNPVSYPGLWFVSVLNVQPNNTISTPTDQAVIVIVIVIDATTTDTTMYRETRDKVGSPLSATG